MVLFWAAAPAQMTYVVTNTQPCTFKLRLTWVITGGIMVTSYTTIAPTMTTTIPMPGDIAYGQARLYTTGNTFLSAWFPVGADYHKLHCASTFAGCTSCPANPGDLFRLELVANTMNITCGACD